ncbi:hypothetical protein F2P81_004926 [Scophthalmus maximus]|uniref:Reverse transcriptase domain-containing protein n=1 Tax=Scophthalmus maximus TaxID=52904 RepID=A0A6A4TFJ1_SCOMX|nr:hypothetical protein F2P81_004926 [Scophthalmus maximus]
MEKIVVEQIVDHLNNSPYTLNRMQFGFRKHHSTETAVCFFLENIKSKLDAGGVISAVFIDLRKAFDTLNHQILLTKLSHFNFSEGTHTNWIESYISARSQCVRIRNMKSTSRNNNLGVPQGSVLGPLLFSLFINDLPSCCPLNVTCQMYADDAVLNVHAKDRKHAAQELTDAMTNVYNWLEKSQLYLNISKTVCMYLSKRANTDSDPKVSVQGKTIESGTIQQLLFSTFKNNSVSYGSRSRTRLSQVLGNVESYDGVQRHSSRPVVCDDATFMNPLDNMKSKRVTKAADQKTAFTCCLTLHEPAATVSQHTHAHAQ